MDLVVKGRGVKVTDDLRHTAQRKLAKLERLHRRPARVEVELIQENPRIDGGHRVDVAYSAGRRTFRAEGTGRDLETALDQVADRLERQLTSYRGKLRARLLRRGNRLQSPRTSPEGPGSG
jgi:putative sigma-54 modulation protein